MSERKGIDWEPDAVSIRALQAEQPPSPVSMARWIYRARLAMVALIGECDEALRRVAELETENRVAQTDLANLRSALVSAGHDQDCPVVWTASVDCVPGGTCVDWQARAETAETELARLRSACVAQSHAIEQALGKALGYSAYQDDLANFPDATEAEGVCVADHTAESLADEAAAELARLQPVVAAVRGWACQTDAYLAACNRDTEVGWQEEGRRLDAAVTVLRAALDAADKEASGG